MRQRSVGSSGVSGAGNSPFSPCRKWRALCIGVFGGEGVIGEQMCFASCAQDLDSREDTSADPILAADASITPSDLVGVGVTDFAASFPVHAKFAEAQ